MKTLGLIGGTSWVSTVEYYSNINKLVNERLGGLNSAKLILYSVNFEEYIPPADPRDWDKLRVEWSVIALKLQSAGAECIVMCANTPHVFADDIQQSIKIPIIHIAEATAKEILKKGLNKAALLGTRITMEQPFFRKRLEEFGVSAITPDERDRAFVHSSIFSELGKNVFTEETKNRYLKIIDSLRAEGADGIILGCTEIPMLIKQSDCDIPLFDTTLIHCKAAVDFALGV